MIQPALPPELAAAGDRALRQLSPDSLDAAQRESCIRVFALSDFAAGAATRQADWFVAALADHGFARPLGPADIETELARELEGADKMPALQQGLRRIRQRLQLWLVWRHLLGDAPLEETSAGCSLLADSLIDAAYRPIYRWACERRGTPLGIDSGAPQHLVVLALGKLGGGELNLSSDVDLVFAYPEVGNVQRPGDADDALSNQQFFIRLGQDLIQALDPVTVDGFVFRVDMRLRPHGGSGPLVIDFARMENYYANEGRDWERYALMKARPCAGDIEAGAELLDALRPFVYRRYLDFGAIDALRDMKQKLLAERHLVEDIKLGPGGIRDAEFAVQMMQMVWGGRVPALQRTGLIAVVKELVSADRLDADSADELVNAYRFLRDTEHSLQAENDRQTQRLPTSPESQLRLALSRGFADYESFSVALAAERARVTSVFEMLVGPEQPPEGSNPALWEAPDAEALAAIGFKEPAAAVEALEGLKAARDRNSVSATARGRLDRLMPELLDAAGRDGRADVALSRALPVIRAVLRRSAYLSLLAENPEALERFLDVISSSLWLAESLARYPAFLDALLDERGLTEVPDAAALRRLLGERLAGAADLEARLDVLREFKSHHVFDVALAETRGALPLMRVSDALTFLAEAILAAALDIAWNESLERFPEYADDRAFVILGYGKLGGIELGPGSDLDIVFIHDLSGEAGPFLNRFTRQLLSVLTAPTYHGSLYEIDTRLRPSGNAGSMVSSLDAFRDYQESRAWVWEHQALVRARPVAGDPALAARFEATRRHILEQPRDRTLLREQVLKMRQRIQDHQGDDEDLKRGSGGIVDIEFMVQYLVLAWAHQHPSLTEYTDNVRILDAVEALELLPAQMTGRLREAYIGLRAEGHRSALDLPDRERAAEVLAEYRNDVRTAWQRVFES